MEAPSAATMRAFYGDALELTIVSESNEEIAFRAGSSTLRFVSGAPRAVYAYDPAGNIIELISFSQLPSPSDATFSSDSFIGLAELGLPVADPHAVRQLSDTFGVGLWDGNEVNEDRLTPVGVQGATFLVAPVGRRWLFGDTAADHPLEVVLGGVREGSLEFADHPYRIVGAV